MMPPIAASLLLEPSNPASFSLRLLLGSFCVDQDALWSAERVPAGFVSQHVDSIT